MLAMGGPPPFRCLIQLPAPHDGPDDSNENWRRYELQDADPEGLALAREHPGDHSSDSYFSASKREKRRAGMDWLCGVQQHVPKS